MKKLLPIAILFLCSACAGPPERTYCEHMGTPPGHMEYNNCVRYYYDMENWFAREQAPCLAQARVSARRGGGPEPRAPRATCRGPRTE